MTGSKDIFENAIKLTVITVCFNAKKTIKRTLESVLSQKCNKFDYLIIDGKSTDGTVEILEEYKEKFKDEAIKMNYISEEDDGLYDAMNKGIRLADGEWLIFMNADDEFYDENAIENFIIEATDKSAVIYGDSCIVDEKEITFRKSQPIDTIVKHLPFIPQSAFIRTEIQRLYLFDTKYKIAADFDCFLRMYLDGHVFTQTNNVFSKFYMGGISNKDEWKTYKEDITIKHNNGIINKYSLIQLLKYIRRYCMEKINVFK